MNGPRQARVRVVRTAAAALAAVAGLGALAPGGGGAGVPRCSARGVLPDPVCTPGAVFRGAGRAEVCRTGYSRLVRRVPYALKRRVYYAYGVRRHPRGSFEIDHLIPLELGGSNEQRNLWPQPAPGFREKDALENALHASVCSGRLELHAAQRSIARNWFSLWTARGRP